MTVVIISHDECMNHLMPDGHPECPERISAIANQLLSSGLDFCVIHKDAKEVSKDELLLVHDAGYLGSLEDAAPTKGEKAVSFGDDIWLSPGTLRAARLAAGAAVQATELVLTGETRAVFCNVRPPGHHAEHNKAMGFCFYNNVAIAAAYAKKHFGLKKVAIVDFDVHHGNGTQDIFLDDPSVLYFSSFQHPLYPDTDIAPNRPNIVNAPLDASASSEEFRKAITESCLPALRSFSPELLIISAGFDAHVMDDMSSVCLMDMDYQWVSEQLREFVDASPKCRGIVSVLEGGYELGSLGRAACAHIKAIAKL